MPKRVALSQSCLKRPSASLWSMRLVTLLAIAFLALLLSAPSTNACSKDQMLNVALFGATGATGKAIVDLLTGGKHAANYVNHSSALAANTEAPKAGRHLTAFTRRTYQWPTVADAPKPFGDFALDNQVLDFEKLNENLQGKLEEVQQAHGPLDVVFCAHGTTRAASGSDEAFIHMDKDMVVEMARAAKAAGVRHFSLVSSAGADKDSMFLYLRTKGQLIEDIKAMGFERFSVFKPGLLITEERPEARIGEKIAVAIDPFLSWLGRTTGVKSLESIAVEDLAASMIANAMRPASTTNGFEDYDTSVDIRNLTVTRH